MMTCKFLNVAVTNLVLTPLSCCAPAFGPQALDGLGKGLDASGQIWVRGADPALHQV